MIYFIEKKKNDFFFLNCKMEQNPVSNLSPYSNDVLKSLIFERFVNCQKKETKHSLGSCCNIPDNDLNTIEIIGIKKYTYDNRGKIFTGIAILTNLFLDNKFCLITINGISISFYFSTHEDPIDFNEIYNFNFNSLTGIYMCKKVINYDGKKISELNFENKKINANVSSCLKVLDQFLGLISRPN